MSVSAPDLFVAAVDPAFAGVETVEQPVRVRRDSPRASDTDDARKAPLLFG